MEERIETVIDGNASARERIDFALVMLGTIKPRDSDELEMAAIFASQPRVPKRDYARSDRSYKRWLAYHRQYQRDHPRTLEQQARDTELRRDARALARFMKEQDKWEKFTKMLATT